MLYSLIFLNFLILYKNCFKFKLSFITYLNTTIILIFFKFFNLKLNIYENNFWLLVELLNNNNKSLVFFFNILVFNIIISKYNLNNFNFISWIFLKFLIILHLFLYQVYINYFNGVLLYSNIVNTTLINGVVLIHPILIYITYFLLITNFLIVKNNFYKINFIIYVFTYNMLFLLICSFLALFLGGWWAQQELNWGGWWNWDFVEIIALVFFILTLFITHNNFFKFYNNLFISSKLVIFYLFCFFLFVRMDVLSSIHSFNSFSILNNFNNYLTFLFLFIVLTIYSISLNFFKKFKTSNTNNKFTPILLLLFKFINYLFIVYFFLNIFFVIYFNYQFVDITKYIKIILILSMYIYILYEFKNKFMLILTLIFLIINFNCDNYINTFNILLYLSLFSFFKKYKYNNFVSIFSHICFLYFILYIKYNWVQIYFTINNYSLLINSTLINSNYIVFNCYNNYKFNYNSIFNFDLGNFYFNNTTNSLYFLKEMYVNNIIFQETSYSFYNFENSILLLFYNINILFYLIIVLSIILI